MQRVVTPTDTTERFYHNGFEYGGSGIELVHTGEGVVNVSTSDNNHRYNYFLKDHLGSTRVVFGEDTQGAMIVNQVTDYYAFGLAHEPGFGMGDTRYLYNGKELQDELDLGQNLSLGWLDYGWRMYDPQIGRWHVIDPLAEKYSSYSPYNYVLNNPVRYIDPDGRMVSDAGGRNPEQWEATFDKDGDPAWMCKETGEYVKVEATNDTDHWVIALATSYLLLLKVDIATPGPSDFFIKKWVVHAVLGGASAIALLSVGKSIKNIDLKDTHTSRGNQDDWGIYNEIEQLRNDQYWPPGGKPPWWFWPGIGGAAAYELYNNWPRVDNTYVQKPLNPVFQEQQ